jgi:hypothetical protein
LHATWLALHVHNTKGQTRLCSRLEGTWPPEGTNIIEESRSKTRALRHKLWCAGIYGDNDFETFDEELDRRQYTIHFFCLGNRRCAGPRRLTTDIQHKSARIHHSLRTPQEGI